MGDEEIRHLAIRIVMDLGHTSTEDILREAFKVERYLRWGNPGTPERREDDDG